jgi:XTP/dITP diphosphohydrolase
MSQASDHLDQASGRMHQPSDHSSAQSRMKLIFATNNRHKVEEIQFAIGDILEVISLRQAGIDIDIPEPHDTLEANASEKSGAIFRLTGMDCFSEDTGLEVDSLNGEPGVKSARYAGEGRSSAENTARLLGKLEGHPNRQARFRTVISLLLGGKEYLFEGICEGRILTAPVGSGGFGYDPVFAPDGQPRSFGEMSLEEKAHYSHRRKAADKLIHFLRESVPSAEKP